MGDAHTHTLATLHPGLVERLEVAVSADDVARFAALSGDTSPLHVDADFARSRGHAGCVAHGLLIGAYVSALVGTRLPGKWGLLQSCDLQFRAPLVPPAVLTVTGEVAAVSAGTGQITLRITVTDADGRLLTTGTVKSIVRAPAAT
jgi:acyl dehydratase